MAVHRILASLAFALLLFAPPAEAGTQRIEFAPGFNFVSLAVAPDPLPSSVDLLAHPEVTQAFRFDPATQSFQYQLKLGPSSLFGSAFTLSPGEGCVVRCDAALPLEFSGPPAVAAATANLCAGFTFAGVPDLVASPGARSLLETVPELESIFRWNPAAGAFAFCLRLSPTTFFGEDFALAPGNAYFLRAKSACALRFGVPADATLAALLPTVTGVSPATVRRADLGLPAGRIVVTGTNFGDDPARIAVRFGTLLVPANQVAHGATELSFFLTDAQAQPLLSTDQRIHVDRIVATDSGDVALRASSAQTVRILPDPVWRSEAVDWRVDYGDAWDRTGTVTKPGATSVRLHFSSITVEEGYDTLRAGTSDAWSGTYSDLTSSAVEGESIALRLTSDESNTGHFAIDRVEWLGEATGAATRSGELFPAPVEPPPPVASGEIVIPEVEVAGGGLQASPAPSGSVYYFNSAHTAEESDIRMDATVRYAQTARRYLAVSGTAVPDDSGYTDRGYHAVTLRVSYANGTAERYSFPVDAQNRFAGYLYFTVAGACEVWAFRAQNDTLYPKAPSRGTAVFVEENWSTLKFTVNVAEAVPADLAHLLPTENVDCGNASLRAYAARIVAGRSTDLEKVRALYEFMVKGDAAGPFSYKFYHEIYPGYLSSSWNSIFLASHMLARRQGVCNDYAELFAALARSLGFRVKKRSGDGTEGGHMWNLILLDGRWQRLDATWGNNRWSYAQDERWKGVAEFYPEFDAAAFHEEHDLTYTADLKETY